MVSFFQQCKGAGIPHQHHPGLLQRLGSACTNNIGHDKEKDDTQFFTRFGPWTPALEYHPSLHPEEGCSTDI